MQLWCHLGGSSDLVFPPWIFDPQPNLKLGNEFRAKVMGGCVLNTLLWFSPTHRVGSASFGLSRTSLTYASILPVIAILNTYTIIIVSCSFFLVHVKYITTMYFGISVFQFKKERKFVMTIMTVLMDDLMIHISGQLNHAKQRLVLL
jgi:hypothetical protein